MISNCTGKYHKWQFQRVRSQFSRINPRRKIFPQIFWLFFKSFLKWKSFRFSQHSIKINLIFTAGMEFLKTNCIVFGSVRLREVKCLSRILDLSEQGQLLSLKRCHTNFYFLNGNSAFNDSGWDLSFFVKRK